MISTPLAPASADFAWSLEEWKCQAGFNWDVAGTTTTDAVGDDGEHLVRFDNGGELPGGVLGRAYSYFGSCGGNNWYIQGLDVDFDEETTWNYGAGAGANGTSDFRSVALHELGHAIQLKHRNKPGDIMHYALTSGTASRTIVSEELAGAQYQIAESEDAVVCGTTLFTSTSCSEPPWQILKPAVPSFAQAKV